MNSPIISTKKQRFDWSKWYKRASTLVAALIAMSGSALVYYNQLEPFQKAEWPWWVPLALAMLTSTLPALFPVVTSYKQKNLE